MSEALESTVAQLSGVLAASSGASRFVAHVGTSMNPTLSEADLLEVVPYGARLIRAGDVILCRPPGSEQLIVHRIVAVAPGSIRTRGDNNALVDPWLLQAGDIVGQVAAARRGETRRAITGGRGGALQAGWVRWRRPLDAALARLLHPAYHRMAGLGLVQALVPAQWRPRVAVFEAGGEPRLRLLVGRHVIGHYDSRLRRWHIRRPFRLLVDPRAFPLALASQAPEG